MKTSKQGKDLIKKFEGCKLNSYKCSAGVWTIGYGNTYYPGNMKVAEGDSIDQNTAERLFDLLLPKYEAIVLRNVKRELTQNQFDALVSHTYNTGGSTTLFQLIDKNKPIEKIEEWWITKYTTANGKTLKGLVNRRAEEWTLYSK